MVSYCISLNEIPGASSSAVPVFLPKYGAVADRKKKSKSSEELVKSQAQDEQALPEEATPSEIEILPAEDEEQVAPLDLEVDESASEPEVDTAPVPLEKDDLPEETAAVVPYDSLQAYLQEIRRYPKLSKEDEQNLALQYYRDKSVEAAYKLVSGNLWLVVKLARDYERAARSLLDLIQEGNIGLMEAVKNFDPYRGVRFPSYAVWWIRAYIIRYVIANWRLVKIGTTQAQRKLFFNLRKEKERLEREGFRPEPKLLADSLNVKESEVVEMEQRLAAPDMSVDAPLETDSESNLLSILPSAESSAEEILAQKETRELILSSLTDFEKSLNSKEKVIFRERMLAEDKVTLQDISEKLKISRERVRQLENKIRDKLKEFISEKFGSGLDTVEF